MKFSFSKYSIYFFLLSFAFISSCSKTKTGNSKGNRDTISLALIQTYTIGNSGENSAEITAYDPESKRLYVANSVSNTIEILDFSNPSKILPLKTVSLKNFGNTINSISIKNGMIAAAIENTNRQLDGFIYFFDKDGNVLNILKSGAQPDMLTFSHSGKYLVVANEGEPDEKYIVDPKGSVTIIEIKGEPKQITQENVKTLFFDQWNDSLESLRRKGVRIYGPGATVSQDLEPEYLTISEDDQFAWITLQENNAIAKVNIKTGKIISITSLNERSFSMETLNLDSSKAFCPVKGYYEPDAIASFRIKGKTYLVTANEGDVRNYEGFTELCNLNNQNLKLDQQKFPGQKDLISRQCFGKLGMSNLHGDLDNDGDIDEIYCFGTRSFSIWDENVKQIYDSGDEFDNITCKNGQYCIYNERYGKIRNRENPDLRGPEPEGVTIGNLNNKMYAFITLERYGGVIVYNVTNPYKPSFVQYINSKKGNELKEESKPEGIIFINPKSSPDRNAYVIVSNEASSTLDVYRVYF